MKKNLFKGTCAVLMFMMISMLFGCVESQLKKCVDETSKKLPVKMGLFGDFTSLTYENNVVTFVMTVDEQFTNIKGLNSNMETVKPAMIAGMRKDNTDKLLDLIIEEEADLCIVFKGKTSGDEAKFQLTYAELKEEMEKPVPTAEDRLALSIETTRKQMPLDTGSGVIMTDIVDRGDVVLYKATVANKNQFDLVKANTESVKKTQKIMLKMLGPVEKKFFMMIAEAGKGLGYSYTTEGSSETIDIIFSNEELKEIFGD